MMFERIRLVVWDLDETFWNGTLTEEGLRWNDLRQSMLIELAQRGIVSSICSKNDHDTVQKIMVERGVWDYFVFPSINWEPKGQRIKELIDDVQLRPATVLFVDDNPMNLNEALFFVPDLQTCHPDELERLFHSDAMSGKDDANLSRLAQYKLLETRKSDEKKAGANNTDFLRGSGIQVYFEYDLDQHMDRVVELINRTNQLNFTKHRLPESPDAAATSLSAYLKQYNVQAALVRVRDNYGDYGFCGFYAIETGYPAVLRHFLFSCRILNMGIEQWLYRTLGSPYLKVEGEVLSDPINAGGEVDWITMYDGEARRSELDVAGVVVRARGGCDLQALTHYFRTSQTEVVGEFNFMRGGLPIRLDHSLMFAYALDGLDPGVMKALLPLQYEPSDFETHLFREPDEQGVWVFSCWMDPDVQIYRHRETGARVPWHLPGKAHEDLVTASEDDVVPFVHTPEARGALDYLRSAFVAEGPLSPAETQQNLDRIFSRVPPGGRMYVLLANEWMLNAAGSRYYFSAIVGMNQATRAAAADHANVVLVDVREFISAEAEVHSLSHFDRLVYHRIYRYILADLRARTPAPAAMNEPETVRGAD